MDRQTAIANDAIPSQPPETSSTKGRSWLQQEDTWAMLVAFAWLAICLSAVWLEQQGASSAGQTDSAKIISPLNRWISKPDKWNDNPLDAILPQGNTEVLIGLCVVLAICLAGFALPVQMIDRRGTGFVRAFPLVFLLAVLAHLMAEQDVVHYYGLSYALWALVAGLLISNTVGTPAWLKPAVRTELYIKTGLVILGAEVLFSELLALGVPGIFVAWIVTPIVLIATFWFGQRILRIESPSLNMVISSEMSVCGISAAIATAAACRAKKEELSVAVGLSLVFTVMMMIAMPAVIRALSINEVLGGAWIGGTIDSTGAVGAAGAMLGEDALKVATTVKMIQNILIGVTAFAVAVYWIRYQTPADEQIQPTAMEIWRRFPKFVLGFVAVSLVFSGIYSLAERGPQVVAAVIADSTKTMHSWLFSLAFVSIGLDSNFRDLAQQFRGGKPLILYVVGQSFNLALTLAMAWLMFQVVFPGAADVLAK